jgi:flagellar biosynthetic protein FliR
MNVLAEALSVVDISLLKFELFVLTLIRVSAIVFLMPVLSGSKVIPQVKIGLVFFITLALFPNVNTAGLVIQEGTGMIFWLVIREAMVGVVMGLTGMFLFSHVDLAAEIINREMGLNQAPIMDPVRGENSSVLTTLLVNIFTVAFLLSGFHVFFFELLAESFERIPLTGLVWDAEKWSGLMITLLVESFIYGIRLSAPVFAAILVSLIGMSIASRIMPQLNIWILSIPVKIGIGCLVLYYSLPMMYSLFEGVFGRIHLYGDWVLDQAGGIGG